MKKKDFKNKTDIVLISETEVNWQDTPNMKLHASIKSLV
jgi:hypothetical protein